MQSFDILSHVDFIAVALVILGGVFAKKYFDWWGINTSLKTLIFGTVFIAVYLMILHASGTLYKADYSKYFISYTVATSLYEVVAKMILGNIKKNKN